MTTLQTIQKKIVGSVRKMLGVGNPYDLLKTYTVDNITDPKTAYANSMYLQACLKKNATYISGVPVAMQQTLEKFNYHYTWKKTIYSLYHLMELHGYGIFWYERSEKILWLVDPSDITRGEKGFFDWRNRTLQTTQHVHYTDCAIIRNMAPTLTATGASLLTEGYYNQLNIDYQQAVMELKFFRRGLFSGAYLISEGILNDQEKDNIKAQLAHEYSGSKNAGSIPIFPKDLELKTITMNPSDFKKNEGSGDTIAIKKACMMTGVPPPLLGIRDAGWGKEEDVITSYFTGTIRVYCESIADEINLRLLPLLGIAGRYEYEYHKDLTFSKINRETNKALLEYVKYGVYTVNDVRDQLFMPHVPWGDKPMNMQPVKEETGEKQVFGLPKLQVVQVKNTKGYPVDVAMALDDAEKRRSNSEKIIARQMEKYYKAQKKDVLAKIENAETTRDLENVSVDKKFGKYIISIGKSMLPHIYYDIGQGTFILYKSAYGDLDEKRNKLSPDELDRLMEELLHDESIMPEYATPGFELNNPNVLRAIEDQANKLSINIYGTDVTMIHNEIKKVLAEIYEEGLGINETAKRVHNAVSHKYDSWLHHRVQAIARTESTTAYTHAATEGAKQASMDMKSWLHSGNMTNPREEHVAAEGDWIPIDADFEIGGTPMYGPGDGPAEQVVNCGCSLIFGRDVR